MLWSTAPDAELLALAAKGQLSSPEHLRAQTERLLSDARAERFTRNFTGQWLDLREIDLTTPDKQLYPEFDDTLKEAMLQTAGFMLGGWLVVAAVRVWMSGKSGKYAGHFTYADPETLYQASGANVAVTTLADLRIRLEQHYQDNRAYGPAAATTCRNEGNNALTISGNKYFDIDCTTSNSGQNYTLTATGKTGSVVAGYEYTLNDTGAKGTTQYAGQAVTSSCWALKSASDCS